MHVQRHGRRFGWAILALLSVGGCAKEAVQMRPVTTSSALSSGSTIAQPTLVEAQVSIVSLGESRGGKAVTASVFGESGPTVLIVGGIHGNEPTGAGVCRQLNDYLTSHPQEVAGHRIILIPEANPDGLARKLRTNSALVDINRNFPAKNWKKTRKSSFYGGDSPESEPETRLLMAAVERFQPLRICSVHSMDEPCNNFDGPAEKLAKRMAAENQYPVKSNIGYPTPGSFGSWAGIDRRIPLITLELPNRGTTAKSWTANREALLAFIRGEELDGSSFANGSGQND